MLEIPDAHPTFNYAIHISVVWLSMAPVYDNIFDHLSLAHLIRVSHTCWRAYHACISYKRKAFSITRLLSRFFDDPCTFRVLQARTGTLIAGSQALQFLGRWYWPNSDLDIYTCPGHSLEVGKWIESQGYHFVASVNQPVTFAEAEQQHGSEAIDIGGLQGGLGNAVGLGQGQSYTDSGIHSVFSFEKETSLEVLKIQIIASKKAPLEVILGSHSTVVMNFISWNKAYSLYPYATFEKLQSFVCCHPVHPEPRESEAMKKYSQRGFTMVDDPYAYDNPRCAFELGDRFVGDKFSMVMSLDTEGVTRPDHECGPMENFDQYLLNGWTVRSPATFRLSWNRPNSDGTDVYCTQFRMQTWALRSSVLRNVYLLAPRAWVNFVIAFLTEKGDVECTKPGSSEWFVNPQRHDSKPETWKFYDEELPLLLSQWRSEREEEAAARYRRMISYFEGSSH